jgi:hypothetical protein
MGWNISDYMKKDAQVSKKNKTTSCRGKQLGHSKIQ